MLLLLTDITFKLFHPSFHFICPVQALAFTVTSYCKPHCEN